ncbi:Lipoprotein-releasing system transmembrane protein LolC [Planctomycetes bacterium Pla163]|uniref:Lipoprotein-releasing system transmembrane protein LolC n=1 Tax=Rohdeia mirabilis TaxID=2528008 RepID=A0A518D011_9BACT|nr:Lipoprotein-releasing system transmembrane protein LolC [Planctomycetes bacterium Pla163]
MYRVFLSWRYLLTRRTNWIGVGGIFVAVGALILILSIMSGFLESSRAMLRGDLSDLAIAPSQEGRGTDGSSASSTRTPAPLLERLFADERVEAASPRLVWYAQAAGDGRRTERLMAGSAGDLSAIQLIGVELRTPALLAEAAAAPLLAALGLPLVPTAGRSADGRARDEFSTTEFFHSLRREPLRGMRVQNPLLPFERPRSYRTDGRPAAAIVMGESLMSGLSLVPGDEVEVVTILPSPDGSVTSANRRFVVAGSFRTGAHALDLERIYMDRAELEDLLSGHREYSEILVRTKDYDEYGAALKVDLERDFLAAGLIAGGYGRNGEIVAFPGQVKTWEDSRQNLIGAIKNERVLMAIMLSLILVVSGFTIFSILTMMVTEKRRDIGILAAVGATPRGIMSTFLLIGFWNAFLGTLLGAAGGILGATYINDIEIWLSDLLGVTIFNREIYYFDEIPSDVEPMTVLWIAAGAFTSTLLFSAIPAWRAARVDPLVALRNQ